MKVVCVKTDQDTEMYLTVGKVYSIIKDSDSWWNQPIDIGLASDGVFIKDDMNHDAWYNKQYFKYLEEIRQDKLNSILL